MPWNRVYATGGNGNLFRYEVGSVPYSSQTAVRSINDARHFHVFMGKFARMVIFGLQWVINTTTCFFKY
jgi:hypothetical protein